MNLHLSIITPTKVLVEEEVEEVVTPTTDGVLGILPNHAPLLSQLAPGELIIKKGNKSDSMIITGGFLEMSDNKLSILADYAVNTKDIDIAKAEAAKARAEKLMKEKLSDLDYAEVEKELARALAEISIAIKYKPK